MHFLVILEGFSLKNGLVCHVRLSGKHSSHKSRVKDRVKVTLVPLIYVKAINERLLPLSLLYVVVDGPSAVVVRTEMPALVTLSYRNVTCS